MCGRLGESAFKRNLLLALVVARLSLTRGGLLPARVSSEPRAQHDQSLQRQRLCSAALMLPSRARSVSYWNPQSVHRVPALHYSSLWVLRVSLPKLCRDFVCAPQIKFNASTKVTQKAWEAYPNSIIVTYD